jgi:PTS system nitrogen regulatory IIA component
MNISTILNPSRTQYGVTGSSKKRVLENIANLISEDIDSIDANLLFDSLIARERLGSTGLGNGIAIPHCRNANCDTIIGSLIKLEEPVDFDAIDNQPVDLLFVLLVPEQANDEHLSALAAIAEMFSDEEFCTRLRDCADGDSLYKLAISH